jgi:hypothetical protein
MSSAGHAHMRITNVDQNKILVRKPEDGKIVLKYLKEM